MMDYEGCCGDGAPPDAMVDAANEAVALRAENACLQRSLELKQHELEVAVMSRGEVVVKAVELVNEIARLQAALEDAREHWKRCEEGWNKVIRQAGVRGEALPDPGKLRVLADWFDADDAGKGRRGSSLATLGGQPPDEVQRELRRWASEIEAAIAISPEEAREKEGR